MEAPTKSTRKRYQIMLDPEVRREARRIAAEQDVCISDAVNFLIAAGVTDYDARYPKQSA